MDHVKIYLSVLDIGSSLKEFTGYFAEIQFLTVISSYNRIALELNILIATSADICDN